MIGVLKSCPFCNGEASSMAVDNTIAHNGEWFIECFECFASISEAYIMYVKGKNSKPLALQRAVKLWNARKGMS